MDAATLVLAIFGVMLVYFVLGAQVGFALGGLAMAFGAFTWGPQAFKLIPTTIQNSTTNFLLLAVPLFIFLGSLIEMTGMARAMIQFLAGLLGHVRGGLSYVLIGAMYLVSGISG